VSIQVASAGSSGRASEFVALGMALPARPLSTADRASEDARVLESCRGMLDWEAKVTAAEVSLSSIGGRAYVLGEDRWGMTYFVLGAHDPHVWVRGRLEATSAEPRMGGGRADANGGGAGSTPGSPARTPVPQAIVAAASAAGIARGILPARGALAGRGGFSAVSLSAGSRAGAPPRTTAHPVPSAPPAHTHLRPGEWAVYDSPESLAALIRVLHPLGRAEGPLRQALLRREPLLRAAMAAAQLQQSSSSQHQPTEACVPAAAASAATTVPPPPPDAAPSSGAKSEGRDSGSAAEEDAPSAACAFCAQPIPAAPAASLLHCVICHTSFPVGPALGAAARALFVSHVRGCWAAAEGSPVRQAIAVACATAAPRRCPSASQMQAAADAVGAPFADVAAAFDPVLFQLKRQAVCLAEAVDWSRLRHAAVWPPASRAAWAHAVLTAPSGGDLNRLLHVLGRVLQADDAAAASTARAVAPAALAAQREGARKRSATEIASMTAAAAVADPAAPPGSLKWRWVPAWFLDQTPDPEATVGVRTASAAAWTLRTLAKVLQPNLLPRAVASTAE
jgi:hypothetical protein